MFINFIKLLIIFQLSNAQQSLQCGEWNVYKDEKCFKVFDKELLTYADAKNICYQNEGSSLVSIRSLEEQNFLYTLLHTSHKLVNNIWIGANVKERVLNWTDNTTVNYTNWETGYPITESGYDCVIMEMIEPHHGKWLNQPCDQKNLDFCQKQQNWLFSYLQQNVMELREQFDALKIELESTKKYLQEEIKKSTPPGTISYFANNTVPLGWLKANGQTVSRITYDKLFATIGTTFGSGDGSTTFKLPDLRGEFIRSWSDGRDVDVNRVFGSLQYGSTIPFAGYINNSTSYAGSTAYQNRYAFAGNTFDGGFENSIQNGEILDELKLPDTKDYQSDWSIVSTTGLGKVTSWNLLRGTRPRNIALLACIKY